MQHILRNSYSRICQDNTNTSIQSIRTEIQQSLEDFDASWCKFEQLYVLELMLIETDARRFITKSIECEKELEEIELSEKQKGRILVITD